jgi:ParB family chromosome partitioning protein
MTSHILINTSDLSPNPLQPRGQILVESLEDLMASIQEHGILEPLVVAETPAGLQIIAGERRWRAAKELGLKQVPAIVKKTTPQGMLEMAIVENIQRTNLNPIDRGNAYKRMIEDFDMMAQEVARRIGKSASYVSNAIRILELSDAVKDGLISGVITEGHAKALTALDHLDEINEVYKEILKKNLSVRQTEEYVRRFKLKKNAKISTEAKEELVVSEKLDKIRVNLEEKIGAKFRITRSDRLTRVIITIQGGVAATENKFKKIYASLLGN